MTEDTLGRKRKRTWLWVALAVPVVILAVVIVPPLVSVSRYKSRITQLMSASLGRPVRLASVEMHLLPRPGFELTDLTVEEDPAYGAEPVLHANTVSASIRLLPLWRGQLELSRISVNEASLNLVRTAEGRWNLDSLFRTAAAQANPGKGNEGPRGAAKLPYLEATNSRINIKNGAEKLPYSLLGTDLSLWQTEPGDWRIRLRGQPARTDVSLDLADTGMVRLEGSVRHAAELRQMPLHLDLEWREAQIGQLSLLLIGSDPGWRGDLTGELHLDGTAEAAQVKTRLRAAGVHRREFAPATTLDFDANCGLVYHFTARSIEHMVCDSPLGNGRIRLTGELPGDGSWPRLSVELDQVPVAAGLDALRTVRSGFGPGLEARGAVSGKITFAGRAPFNDPPQLPATHGKTHLARNRPPGQGPLSGSFTVQDFQLSGDGLGTPIHVPRLVFDTVAAAQEMPQALTATVAIPAGAAAPLNVTTWLALSGYQVTLRGQASIARARELAHVAGLVDGVALDSLAGDPITVDLSAEGPWLVDQSVPFTSLPSAAGATGPAEGTPIDRLTGSISLRNSNFKADYLANHVEISQATLHLGNGEIRWDPVVFSYGPLKGTATLVLPAGCQAPLPCPQNSPPSIPPTFSVQFGDLDAAVLQSALLGAHEPGTMLTTLIARLRPSSAVAWPHFVGTVKADSLTLGPVTLRGATAAINILSKGAEIDSLNAGLLGGRVHLSGTLHAGAKPAYTLQGQLNKLNPPAVGQLLGLRCSGGAIDADGKIDFSGLTDHDLATSVKGTLNFDWRRGAMGRPVAAGQIPPALARFDRWTANADIVHGDITLKQNQIQQGASRRSVQATVTLGAPLKISFAAVKATGKSR